MKKVCLALTLFLAIAAQAKTEFGKLQGAEFRIDVPDNWNHGLVVYYHGYAAENHGKIFNQSKPLDPWLAVMTNAGYAVIQSGYSQGGWALEQFPRPKPCGVTSLISTEPLLRHTFLAHPWAECLRS
jgi:hypothetical protein